MMSLTTRAMNSSCATKPRCRRDFQALEELLKFASALNSAVADRALSSTVDVPPVRRATSAPLRACAGHWPTLTVRRAPHHARPPHLPQAAHALVESLHAMGRWIDEIPPIQQPMRYGNKAFRSWHARLVREAPHVCERVAGAAAAVELAPYLTECFGNATRIDYGTGHETTFVVFLRAWGSSLA